MLGPLLLLAVFILPSTRQQTPACTTRNELDCRALADNCWKLTKLEDLKRDIGIVLAAVAELAKIAQLEPLQVELTNLIKIVQVS